MKEMLIIRDKYSREYTMLGAYLFPNEEEKKKAEKLVYDTMEKYPGEWDMEDINDALMDLEWDGVFVDEMYI